MELKQSLNILSSFGHSKYHQKLLLASMLESFVMKLTMHYPHKAIREAEYQLLLEPHFCTQEDSIQDIFYIQVAFA